MKFLATAAFASGVSAHAIMNILTVGGVSQGLMNGIRVPDYDGPITDVTSNDVICNGGINPYHQPISKTVIPVAAGSTIITEWHHTNKGLDPSDPADPIDASHLGPVMVYMAKVADATSLSVTGLSWFKIMEDGLDSSGKWGVQRMIANKGKVSVTIPSCIAPGDYLLRAELIALHAAGSYPGAQLYMECAQIRVTGGGSTSPAGVSFPGAYKGSDPGITYNLYSGQKTYTIPGPRPFTCGGTQPPPPPPPASSTAAPTPRPSSTLATSVRPSSSPAAPVSSAPPSTCTAAKYAQCGGNGFTGCTTCASGSKCVAVSPPYYSQCQ